MTEKEITKINETYYELLCKQQFIEKELDYSNFEKLIPKLELLAKIGNSGISVFDMHRKQHIFYSPNFCEILGYSANEIIDKGHDFLDSKIHPDDYIELTKNGITLLKLFFQFTIDEKTNYKLINEYRILNADNKYIKILEQHQVLELDLYGNLWLSLSTIDVSPNQDAKGKIKSQLINYRTGKVIEFKDMNEEKETISISLSQRERQILQLVKEGFLSKEISDKLSISLHTVNTHRQKLLKKLNANNSMEAIVFASKLGLL